MRAVTAKEAEKFGLAANQGAVVSWVDQKGPLGAAGFKEGDMIPEVNGGAITSVDAFIEAVAGLRPRQRATLLAVDHHTGNAGTIQIVAR